MRLRGAWHPPAMGPWRTTPARSPCGARTVSARRFTPQRLSLRSWDVEADAARPTPRPPRVLRAPAPGEALSRDPSLRGLLHPPVQDLRPLGASGLTLTPRGASRGGLTPWGASRGGLAALDRA